MPQNSEELIDIYRKVISFKLKNWVVFENGTCVIIYNPKGNLKTEASDVLKKYGTVTAGSSSADFTLIKADSGWIVAGDQPGILNYVSESEGDGKEDYEIGLIGRDKKDRDSRELIVIHINK